MLEPPYHVGGLSEALLAIGDELLETRSHHSLTLRELARRVPEKKPKGVSHTAIFAHFESMPDYLTALAARWWLRLEEALVSGGSVGSPVEMGLRYVAFALDHPSAFRLMYDTQLWEVGEDNKVSEERRGALHEARDGCFRRFREAALNQPWARGMSDNEVQLRARLFGSLSHGLSMEFLDEGLFGHVIDPARRKEARLFHARQLLALAERGAER